jgi:hypothetical protein
MSETIPHSAAMILPSVAGWRQQPCLGVGMTHNNAKWKVM